jgi:hypothetical protein
MRASTIMVCLALTAGAFSACSAPAAESGNVPVPAASPLPPKTEFRAVTLPEHTKLVVRLDSAVASDTSRVEDQVQATLADPVIVDGTEVFPAGSIVKGSVAGAHPSGKVKGRASLALRFTSIEASGRDDVSPIEARTSLRAPSTKGKDAATIAVPAAGGAVIGGLVGGKKGAVIGTAVGGGAGTAVVLSTSGDEVRLAPGAKLTLTTERAVDVRVPVARQSS